MANFEQKWLDELEFLNRHERIKDILDKKIALFKANFEKNGEIDLFLELVYCLLTAQTKFVSAALVVDTLKYDEKFDIRLFKSSDAEFENYLALILRQHIIRFHNNKARNIVYSRNLFVKGDRIILREKLSGFKDLFEMRKWLIDNVMGLSYKEASHFLRNIGFGKEFAILDRHVLRTLNWLGIIEEIPDTLSPSVYLDFEKRLKNFSDFSGISMEKMDFLLFILSKKHIEKDEIDIFSVLEKLK